MFAAIILTGLVSAVAIASTIGTIQAVMKDGYGPIPTRYGSVGRR
jgi:hypothetical protein